MVKQELKLSYLQAGTAFHLLEIYFSTVRHLLIRACFIASNKDTNVLNNYMTEVKIFRMSFTSLTFCTTPHFFIKLTDICIT